MGKASRDGLGGFRDRLVLISSLITAVSIIGLAITAKYQPKDEATGRLGETTFITLVNLFAVLLSVGVISLIVELFLRESYAEATRRYLGLNTAIVKSGLTNVQAEPFFFGEKIQKASTITAIARDPQIWVGAHMSDVMIAAKARAVTIQLLIPDVDGTDIATLAFTLGYRLDDLKASVTLCAETVRQRWSHSGALHSGSTIVVRGIDMATYDVTIADDFAVIFR